MANDIALLQDIGEGIHVVRKPEVMMTQPSFAFSTQMRDDDCL